MRITDMAEARDRGPEFPSLPSGAKRTSRTLASSVRPSQDGAPSMCAPMLSIAKHEVDAWEEQNDRKQRSGGNARSAISRIERARFRARHRLALLRRAPGCLRR